MFWNLLGDIRYAWRALLRSPGFAVAAIVTIALGVGVNTGIFTVLNGVLFRELPAPDAHELLSIYQSVRGSPDRQSGLGVFSTEEYRAYRDRTQTLAGLIGYSDPTRTTLGGESPRQILGALVTCNYFDVLRQPPVLGRGLTASDCDAGANPVVVLSHELWATAFAADPTIVGRAIELNRQFLTVVGVAATDTYGGYGFYRTAYFAPISTQPLLLPNEDGYTNVRRSWLLLVGRRDPGASLQQVRAELTVIAAQIDAEEPGRATTLRIDRATPLSIPVFRGVALAAGAVVMTAFGLVLLLACTNVANLLLARATVRSREIALRLSLGASRARVVRQLLTESVLISVIGGALGAVLALWSFQALTTLLLRSLSIVGIPPLLVDPSPDVRVLSLTLALMLGTGMLFGVVPALRASKPDLVATIKGAPGTSGQRSGRLQGTFVGVQVAVCMVLMIGSGLLLRGLYATQTIDPGFAYRDVAYASYDLRSAGYDPERATEFQRRLLQEVEALPGVDAAAQVWTPPLTYTGFRATSIRLPGQPPEQARQATLNVVSPKYFSLIGIPIVRGRAFADAELTDNAGVAVVTESTARNFWPGRDPIGQSLVWQQPDRAVELRVVGVAKDAEVTLVGQVDPYYLYLPAGPGGMAQLGLVVKTRTDFAATATAIRRLIGGLDAGVVVAVSPLEGNIDFWRGLSGAVTTLAATLGGLALLLASVGIYGVVSYFVGYRFREMGVRLALGARSFDVLAFVLRRTLRPVAIGAVIGVVGAVAVSGVLSAVLFGVSAADPVGIGGAALFVLCVAVAAGALAARRATRVDPAVTLRCD
jgi:putative ABC transport system permease protein